MPGGRASEPVLRKTVEAALNAKFGEGKWIDYASYGSFWLNRATIREKNLLADVEAAAEALMAIPHVYRASRVRSWLGQSHPDRVGLRLDKSSPRLAPPT